MEIENLMLEVTRKCNFECAHCLRGDSMAMEMTEETVDEILEGVSYISIITFSGGEPFLNIPIIEYVLKQLKAKEIGLGDFFISTNGSVKDDRIVPLITALYDYCDEKDTTQLQISTSQFHRWFQEDKYNTFLEMLKITYKTHKDRENIPDEHILNRGKAYWNGLADKNHESAVCKKAIIPEGLTKNDLCDKDLYVSCSGDVFIDCDLSYHMMDENVCEENGVCGEVEPVKLCTALNFKEIWEGLSDD